MGDDRMKMLTAIGLTAVLCLGLVSSIQGIAVLVGDSSFEEIILNQSLDRLRYMVLNDAAPAEEFYGSTDPPEYGPLEIHQSDDDEHEYMGCSPYYTVYFEGVTVKMIVGDAWISFSVPDQELGDVTSTESVVGGQSIAVSGVFASVDLFYDLETSLLRESLILKEKKQIERIVHDISWGGVTPIFQDDGSILFSGEKELFRILPPFMEDAEGNVCRDIHYELIETESGYELHKVIDENGLTWLDSATTITSPSWSMAGETPVPPGIQRQKLTVTMG
jgi:hypothetical protein